MFGENEEKTGWKKLMSLIFIFVDGVNIRDNRNIMK